MFRNYLLVTLRNRYKNRIYALIILFITVATITGKIYQAVLQNPVRCMRYE